MFFNVCKHDIHMSFVDPFFTIVSGLIFKKCQCDR